MSGVLALPERIAPEAEAAWRADLTEIVDAAFAPRSRLSLSQWADQKRWLSADLGEPGQWRTDRVPYMRGIMDAITDPRVREVSIMKPTRIGATQAVVLNAIGYCVDQEPKSIIVALPTKDDAVKFSTQLLQPMFDDTPCLQGKLDEARSSKHRSTQLSKTYPGGGVHIIGVKSPRTMRMIHAQWILMSEIDAWDFSAGAEGAPDKLLEKRAGAYGNPKFVRESSPLLFGTSRIEAAVLTGSQERFFVPCPHCGEYQRLVWGGREVAYGLKWDRTVPDHRKPETVHYVCEKNGCVIEEPLKFRMTAAGEWVAAFPDRTEHRSFYLNALVSPFEGARWGVLVKEFLETRKKPERLKVFVNTVLGETFREQGKSAEATTLEERKETYTAPVPAGVGKLVQVFDTQDDRLERLVVGFGADEELWPIEHEIIKGDPGIPMGQPGSPWDVATERLELTYLHESGIELAPAITGIDLGGHHTKEVYAWTRKHLAKRVYALQGSNVGEGAPMVSRQKYSNTGRTFFYSVGSFTIKEAIMARLTKIEEPGPGYIHIADWMDREHLAQLTAEELVTGADGKREWKKRRDRNEFLDLIVYAFGMLHALGYGVVRSLGDAALALMAEGQALKAKQEAERARVASGEPSPAPDPDAAAEVSPIGLRLSRNSWGPR